MGRFGSHNNCMSYALNRKVWAIPKGWRIFNDEPSRENLHYLIKNFETVYGLKPVSREEMVLGKEYIAFRYEQDGYDIIDDFHFAVRHKSGHWTHKMGSKPVEGVSEKIIFADEWAFGHHYYNSKIYLFER